jgi:hypothetical protein
MCVEPFIKFWLSVQLPSHNVRPLVYLIADRIPDELLRYESYIQLCAPASKDLDSGFLAQISRLVLPSALDADCVLTTDIDMLPLSQRLTRAGIKELGLSPDSIIVLRDVLPPGEYPICYNLGSPSTFGKLLGGPKRVPKNTSPMGDPGLRGAVLEQFARRLLRKYAGQDGYSGIHGGAGWNIDQVFLWDQLSPHVPGGVVKLLNDSTNGHRRLDRSKHVWPLNWLVLPLAVMGFYTDYHLHHPIWRNHRYIKILFLGRLLIQRLSLWNN